MDINAGSTDVSLYYYITGDASHASPGDPITGLVFSDFETGGSGSYIRQGAARVDITLITLASASAAHSDGGLVEVDATNAPGVYRVDYPDAAFSSGVAITICTLVAASANNASIAPLLVDIKGGMPMTESYAAKGAAPTEHEAQFEQISLMGEYSISSTTLINKKRDGSTTAFTSTLDDASNPTSRTRAT